jgi:hypothetical protein
MKNKRMQRSKRGVLPWQTRWITLHDDLHLLEVLLAAISPSPEYMEEYWSLSADLLSLSEDLQAAYEAEVAANGETGSDNLFLALRRRLTLLQARAQVLSLENDVD